MTLTVGFLIFDGLEELDFAGPWDVFGMSNVVDPVAEPRFRLLAIGETSAVVTCANGLKILPDITFFQCPRIDILLVPGGIGTRREAGNVLLLDWIARTATTALWVTSVCTGSLLLAAAGLTRGKKITTHHAFIETLAARQEAADVVAGVRYLQDGNLVTAAGVSAGIDMTLWLIGTIFSADFACAVQRAVQYEPAPPFAAI